MTQMLNTPDLSNGYALSPEQITGFQRDAVTIVRGLASHEEIAAYRPSINAAVEKFNQETRPLEDRRDSAHVVAPCAERPAAGRVEIDRLDTVVGGRTDGQHPIPAKCQRGRGRPIDGHRHHEPVVIVRVFADEIDAPRRPISQILLTRFLPRYAETNLAPLATAKC